MAQALRESEERFRAVLETAVNGIITMGEDRRIQMVNSAAVSLFGYSREELIGQNVNMLMPQPYRSEHDGYVKDYVRTGQRKIIGIGREVVGMRKDGTTFPMDLSVGEAKLPTGRLFTGIVRDLTERKRLEDRLLQAGEDEQRRIGRDIHDDICQQLAGIGCLLKVIQQNSASGGVAPEQLDEIGRLISDANSRAREIARGLVPVVLESEGLPTALEELAESSSRLFNVNCMFSTEPGVAVEESRTKVHLFRIVKEAIANAVRHGAAKNIWIRMGVDGGKLNLSITDDGKGFSAAEDHSGMGMLTMAHRVKTMTGTIRVESAPGEGTRIYCEIPLT